jgi:hypothetical protein
MIFKFYLGTIAAQKISTLLLNVTRKTPFNCQWNTTLGVTVN